MTPRQADYAKYLRRVKGLSEHIVAATVQHLGPKPIVGYPGSNHQMGGTFQPGQILEQIFPCPVR